MFINKITFGLFVKNGLDVLKVALRLAERMDTVNIVAVKILVKDQNGEVCHRAQVNEILSWKRVPYFYKMPNYYIY